MRRIGRFTSTPTNEIRFTLGLVLITLLVLNVGGWAFYARARIYMEQQSQERLLMVAKAVSAQIDRDRVLSFRPGDELTAAYAEEREKLCRLRDEADLDNVFLFAPYLGSLIDTRFNVAVGDHHPLSDIDSEELSPLWEGEAAGLPVHEISGERFQSAFVPILEEGELRAVVGVDASARFLNDLEIIKRGLLLTALLSIVLASCLGLFVYRNARRLVALHDEIKNREKLAALGTLTAGLAHEIRNPLGIIRASAELQQEEQEELRPGYGKEIIEEVDRLSDLLDRFLGFARPRRLEVHREDLRRLVAETLDRVEQDFREKGVQLSRNMGTGELPIRMDTRQIEQVLLNLLINARDAVNGTGKVEVTLARRGRPRGSARLLSDATRHKAYVEVMVEDTGPGVGEEELERLFDPFFTTKEKGTGLGLSIVHGIIQSHDGYLFVESEEGCGTRIGFGLPA